MHSYIGREGGVEYKIAEAIMVERERWEHRFGAAENGWEATIAMAVAMGGNAKLARNSYKTLHRAVITGDRERGEQWVCATEAGTLRGSRTDLLPRDHC